MRSWLIWTIVIAVPIVMVISIMMIRSKETTRITVHREQVETRSEDVVRKLPENVRIEKVHLSYEKEAINVIELEGTPSRGEILYVETMPSSPGTPGGESGEIEE